jgi:hypothetical protein
LGRLNGNVEDDGFCLYEPVVEFGRKFGDWERIDQDIKCLENRVKDLRQQHNLDLKSPELPSLLRFPDLRKNASRFQREIAMLTDELEKMKQGRLTEFQLVKERTRKKIAKLKKLHQDEITAIIEAYNSVIESQRNESNE